MKNTSALRRTLLIALLACPMGAIVLIVCSCTQQPSKSGLRIENGPQQHQGLKSALHIDNGINRGTDYTDSLGTEYNLRYIPITVTNSSALPIHLQIAFSNEYEYPNAYDDEQFNVFPLPHEWALEGIGVTDSMLLDLPKYIDTPSVSKTLQPGEKFIFAIGSLYSRPVTNSGVLPNALFVHNRSGRFPTCEWRMKEAPSFSPQIVLGIKLDCGDSCTIIPCGQISYPAR